VKNVSFLKNPSFIIFGVVLAVSVLLATLTYHLVTLPPPSSKAVITRAVPRATSTPAPVPTPIVTPTPIVLPVESPSKILGIQSSPGLNFPGISWVRLGYPTCGWGNLYGDVLKSTIRAYHQQGIRVLLTICQGPNNANLYNTQPLKDAAQGGADAVQCGNEEMKQDPSVAFLYIPPENFAKYYDLCERAMHAVRPDIPVLLGSLDPHVGGIDYQPLLDQVQYLNEMQQAMNTTVHPGGHWDWHTQILGLIDSWHNGYPDSSVNSLYGLFQFWAQQFNVNLASGGLGKHLWVVEGTGCFKGCGIDQTNAYQVALAHTLTLITDVQTAMKYQVPFFYFSGEDFTSVGYYWPIGVLDENGHPKPIRQDLPMGARTLTLSCSSGNITVENQEQLLARMYQGCKLPSNYFSILSQ
jgi:hypothetical protein